MKIDNPAARLLDILEQGKKIPQGINCREAWCNLLNVKIDNKALLMGRLGKVMALSTDITESLKKIEGVRVERYTHWVEPLDQAFFTNNLNGIWKDFSKYIDTHVINYLTMTADLLSHKIPESIIEKSQLDSILEDSRTLLDEVKNSDLPEAIKQYMVKQLHKICLAVEEYQITGSDHISTAVETAFGYGLINSESVEIAKSNGTAKKFWQLMANVALIVSISTGVQQLSPTIIKMLPDIEFEAKTEAAAEESSKKTTSA